MSLVIPAGSTVLFTGDSITDSDRRGASAPLGNGYVSMVADLVLAKYPEHDLRLINTGISGNNIRDLFDRWTDDVIRLQPDWLSIMIGINDINAWLSKTPGRSVSPEEYAELYLKNLERVKSETSAKIILIDSFYISTDHGSESYRSRILRHLPTYLETVSKMVEKFGTFHVRYHDMFQHLLKKNAPDRFCPEPVHPNRSGHLLMAYEWLRVLKY
jgi:lysophospholipase L1-like esterase